ncbi:MAG: hypothetical protein ABIH82_02265 [Candidatus Woesearchaeota archaeon]
MSNCYILKYMDHVPEGRTEEPSYFAVDLDGKKVSETTPCLGELASGLRFGNLTPRNLNGHAVPANVIDRFCKRSGEFNRPRLSDIDGGIRKTIETELRRLRAL